MSLGLEPDPTSAEQLVALRQERDQLLALVRAFVVLTAKNPPSPISLAGEVNALEVWRRALAIVARADQS